MRLAEDSEEAAARAAISRAYYAAFHHCRELVSDTVGLDEFGTAEDHARVIAGVRFIDRFAVEVLIVLRRARNRADYDVDANVSGNAARSACAAAARLLELD